MNSATASPQVDLIAMANSGTNQPHPRQREQGNTTEPPSPAPPVTYLQSSPPIRNTSASSTAQPTYANNSTNRELLYSPSGDGDSLFDEALGFGFSRVRANKRSRKTAIDMADVGEEVDAAWGGSAASQLVDVSQQSLVGASGDIDPDFDDEFDAEEVIPVEPQPSPLVLSPATLQIFQQFDADFHHHPMTGGAVSMSNTSAAVVDDYDARFVQTFVAGNASTWLRFFPYYCGSPLLDQRVWADKCVSVLRALLDVSPAAIDRNGFADLFKATYKNMRTLKDADTLTAANNFVECVKLSVVRAAHSHVSSIETSIAHNVLSKLMMTCFETIVSASDAAVAKVRSNVRFDVDEPVDQLKAQSKQGSNATLCMCITAEMAQLAARGIVVESRPLPSAGVDAHLIMPRAMDGFVVGLLSLLFSGMYMSLCKQLQKATSDGAAVLLVDVKPTLQLPFLSMLFALNTTCDSSFMWWLRTELMGLLANQPLAKNTAEHSQSTVKAVLVHTAELARQAVVFELVSFANSGGIAFNEPSSTCWPSGKEIAALPTVPPYLVSQPNGLYELTLFAHVVAVPLRASLTIPADKREKLVLKFP